jgi:hypothetical protein
MKNDWKISLTRVTNSHIVLILKDSDDHCYECGRSDDMEVMLICDRCNFYCCHIYCCHPPLESIPLEDWFCKFCLERPNRRISRSQRREQAAERNQRQTTNISSRGRRATHRETSSTRDGHNQSTLTNYFDFVHQTNRGNQNERQEEHRPLTRGMTNGRNNHNRHQSRYLTRARTLDLTNNNANNNQHNTNDGRYPLRSQTRNF